MTWVDTYTGLRLPLHVFPPTIQKYIDATAESVCVHPEMLCTFMLPIFGALIGNSRSYGYKEDWVECPRIFAAVIADPGAKKSPALARVLAPVAKLQDQMFERNKQELDQWKREDRDTRSAAPPPWQQIIIDNTTIEALAKAMVANKRGLLMKKDELSGWLASMGQYKQGKGDERQQWLEFWSGSRVTINRVGAEHPIAINQPYICLMGGIQPEKAHVLLSKDDDGLVYRFLLSNPPTVLERADTPSVSTELNAAYEKTCLDLRRLAGPTRQIQNGPGGRNQMIDHMQRLLDEKTDKELPPAMRGYWAKFEAYLLRLTVILAELWHVCEDEPEEVTPTRVDQAAELLDYYKGQAITVYGEDGIASAPEYERATPRAGLKVLAWMTGERETTTLRELMRHGPLRNMNRDDAAKVLNVLELQGFVTLKNDPSDSRRIVVEKMSQ